MLRLSPAHLPSLNGFRFQGGAERFEWSERFKRLNGIGGVGVVSTFELRLRMGTSAVSDSLKQSGGGVLLREGGFIYQVLDALRFCGYPWSERFKRSERYRRCRGSFNFIPPTKSKGLKQLPVASFRVCEVKLNCWRLYYEW